MFVFCVFTITTTHVFIRDVIISVSGREERRIQIITQIYPTRCHLLLLDFLLHHFHPMLAQYWFFDDDIGYFENSLDFVCMFDEALRSVMIDSSNKIKRTIAKHQQV